MSPHRGRAVGTLSAGSGSRSGSSWRAPGARARRRRTGEVQVMPLISRTSSRVRFAFAAAPAGRAGGRRRRGGRPARPAARCADPRPARFVSRLRMVWRPGFCTRTKGCCTFLHHCLEKERTAPRCRSKYAPGPCARSRVRAHRATQTQLVPTAPRGVTPHALPSTRQRRSQRRAEREAMINGLAGPAAHVRSQDTRH